MIVFIIDFVVSSLQIKNIGYVIKKKISSINILNMYVKIFNNIPISNINPKSIVLLYFVHIYTIKLLITLHIIPSQLSVSKKL